MPKIHTQRDTPVLMQVLFRPWLLLSLVLHAALLVLPLLPGDSGAGRSLSLDPDSPEPDPPELSVSLSPAPVATPPVVQPSLSPVAPPSPLPAPARVAVPRPTAVSRPRPPAPTAGRSPSPPPSPVATPSPTPAASPSPVPSPAAPATAPTPAAVATPSPAPVPTPIPTPSPAASPDPQESPSPVPYADFPHPDGASTDCGGFLSCWRLADVDGRSVQAIARDLQTTIQAQGYQTQRLEPADDTGSSLYSVTRPGEPPYYVNVISTFNQGTVYLLTDEPMTAEAIREVREGRAPAPQPPEPPSAG